MSQDLENRLQSTAELLEVERLRILSAHTALHDSDLYLAANALSDILKRKPEVINIAALQDWLTAALSELQIAIDSAVKRISARRNILLTTHRELLDGDLPSAADTLRESRQSGLDSPEIHFFLRLLIELGRDTEAPALFELHRAAPAARDDPSPVRFHTLWPRETHCNDWKQLLVYLYTGTRGLAEARNDFRRRVRSSEELADSTTSASLKRGAAVTVVPNINGFIFNPPTATVLWMEDWHCVEFRMRAEAMSESGLPTDVVGRVSFLVGPLLIAENSISIRVLPGSVDPASNPMDAVEMDEPHTLLDEDGVSAYRVIFVSYSHEDAKIVDELEKAYVALGDSYLRDVKILRSGEQWQPRILGAIPLADIFQLCWSHTASQSPYVEQEWRTALRIDKPNFIRPVYWQRPMPEPPSDLRKLHFAFINLPAHGDV
jgi:hypothetical protein